MTHRPLSRRDFAALASGALAGLALPDSLAALVSPGSPSARGRTGARRGRPVSGATPQESFFQWVEVRPDVRVAVGGGGNTVLYLGRRGALQSDGKNFGLGRTLRSEAESFNVLVTHFVNTHHHGDHSGGNEGFPDSLRLAHENAAPRIRETALANLARAEETLDRLEAQLRSQGAPPHMQHDLEEMRAELDDLVPEDFTPHRLFADEYELSVDGLPVECRWVSRGHTDGDTFVFLPRENVLHTGDLFFHGRHPYVDETAGATPEGWVRCVDAMLELCDRDTVVVPGHGEITDREGLRGQKEYFLALRGLVSQGLAQGRSRDEIVTLGTDELAALPGADRHLPRNLGFTYDEMV